MPQFRVEDLLVNLWGGVGGLCGNGVTRCIGVSLPNCIGVSLPNCPGGSLLGCAGRVSLIADCDAGCSLGTCSDACTWCSGECSKQKTCEANKTTLQPSREEDLAELAALKVQLRSALSQVDIREREIHESTQPVTAHQAALVEEQLTYLLEDARARRAQLAQAESDPGDEIRPLPDDD